MTFLEPAFLFGLLAAPLPILIHLFQRRRARILEWSSLEFVRPLQQPRKRRVDLRRLLLLAVRVLALVVFALALARPARTGVGSGQGVPTDAVIVLDASMSMGLREGNGSSTRFDEARAKALDVLDLLDRGDRATVLAAGDPESAASRLGLNDDLATARARVNDARVSSGRLSWSETLASALSVFEDSQGANRELYLISDFQASGWEEDVSTATAALASRNVHVFPVPVGSGDAKNLSIDETDVSVTDGDLLRVKTLVRNHGGRAIDQVAVELVSGEGAPGAAIVSLPEREAAWALVEAPRPEGPVKGRVSLPADDLPADNIRWFGLAPDARVRVLLVGRPSPSAPGESTSQYLRRALAPGLAHALPAETSPSGSVTMSRLGALLGPASAFAAVPGTTPAGFDIHDVAVADLGNDAIEDADVIVLADCGALSESTVDALGRAVNAGTGVFLFLGPGTDAGFMNRVLLPRLIAMELEDASGATTAEGREFGWGRSEPHHPIFDLFPEGPSEAFTRARFQGRITVRAGDGAQVIASFTDGLPALVEGTRGEGRVLVFTSSPDLAWGNFPLGGNFVPFVHESIRYLARAGERATNDHHIGETAHRTLPGDAGTDLVIRTPDGATLPVHPEIRGGRIAVSTGPLLRTGVYVLEQAGAPLDLFAVNADPRESRTEYLAKSAIASALAPLELGGASDEALSSTVLASRYGREFRSLLLWIVFALLVAELLIRGSFLWRAEATA